MPPTVSIIVPCFNAGKFLLETLDSVAAQTYRSWEIVIVDDGSNDPQTVSLLDALDRPGVTVLHQSNAGPSAARNAGMRASRGRYLLPLDADDLIDPEFLAATVGVLDSEPGVGLVYTGTRLFGAESGTWALSDYDFPGILLHNMIPSTALFRREWFDLTGGYDESLIVGYEDWEFWIRVIGAGCMVRQLREVLRSYRILPESRHRSMRDDPAVGGPIKAAIFKRNLQLYLDNLDYVMTAFVQQQCDLADYAFRYARIQRLIEDHPWAHGALRRGRRQLRVLIASWRRAGRN